MTEGVKERFPRRIESGLLSLLLVVLVDYQKTEIRLTFNTFSDSSPSDYCLIRVKAFIDPYYDHYDDPDRGNNASQVTLTWVVNPIPVILVGGFMGLDLDGVVSPAWSEDAWENAETILSTSRLRLNDDETNQAPEIFTTSGVLEKLEYPDVVAYLRELRDGAEKRAPYTDLPLLSSYPRTSMDLFGSLIDKFEQELPTNFYEFQYDWRIHLSNISNPQVAQPVDQLTQLIDTAAGKDGRVAIVSHSQGSLLVLGYLKAREDEEQAHKIQSWVSLGTPFGGSHDAMGILSGRQPNITMVPFVGREVAELVGETFNKITTTYTNLPRGEDVVAYEGWGLGWPGTRFLEREPLTMDELNEDPPDWWNPNQTVYDRALLQWEGPDSALRAYEGIDNVSTLLTTGIPTFDGFIDAEVTGLPILPGLSWTGTKELFYPRFRSFGDGVVRRESALANLVPHRPYYLESAFHSLIPVANGLPELIFELSYGNHPPEFELPDRVTRDGNSSSPGKYMRLLAEIREFWGFFTSLGADGSGQQDIETFPVTFELIELTVSGGTVAGCFSQENSGGFRYNHRAASRSWATSSFAKGDQLFMSFLAPIVPEKYCYRVIIVPSPEFWYPVGVPVEPASGSDVAALGSSEADDDSQFDIGLQVILHDETNDVRFSFPGAEAEGMDDQLIRFSSIRPSTEDPAFGFSAYFDFCFQNGQIVESELTMFVDADGDGDPEGQVSNVPMPSTELGPSVGFDFSVFPNPAPSGNVSLRWSLGLNPVVCEIFEVSGRKIASVRIAGGEGRGRLDANLDSGFYVLRLLDRNNAPIGSTTLVVSQ